MKDNSMKKAVILLGAGFAIPYGAPSSSKILDDMKKDSCGLLKGIISELEKYYGEDYSFETVFAVVESLLMYYHSKLMGTNNRDSNNHSFMPVCYSVQDNVISHCKKIFTDDKTACLFLRDLFDSMIGNILLNIYYDNDDNIKVHCSQYGKLKNFVEELKTKGYALKFYSLNYDRLIPRLFENKIEEGLEKVIPKNRISPENLFFDQCPAIYQIDVNSTNDSVPDILHLQQILFKYDLQNFCTHSFTHFNLHGSRYLRAYNNELVFQDDGLGFSHRNYSVVEGGNPGESHFLSPIIVGQSKTQRAFSQPFKFGFDAFSWDCSTCNVFFSFGYSFKDPHINTILRTYIDDYKTPIHIVVQQDEPLLYDQSWNPWRTRLNDLFSTEKRHEGNTKMKSFIEGMEKYFFKKEYCNII